MQDQIELQPSNISFEAIGDIYTVNHRWLVRWLHKKLSCPHNAADLAQDTFTRLLTSRNKFYVTEAKALLTTIAKGLVVDHFRRQAIEAAYLDALAKLPELHAPSPEANTLILEALCEIDRMLDGLPAKTRQVFLLSQLDGLTYPDIARQLNISVSSVQKYMTQTYAACYAVRYPRLS